MNRSTSGVAALAMVTLGLVGVYGLAQAPAPGPSSAPATQSAPPPAAGGQRAGGAPGAGRGRGTAGIPGTPWRIHDPARPQPPVISPGATAADPPSDAIVLFGGQDLSRWVHVRQGQRVPAEWPVAGGYFETAAGKGSIYTRESFGSVQMHVEFATPTTVVGTSQGRGNSGVKFMDLYEVQILDSFDNPTYADGMAAAIYGEYPPLVNAARRPGAWQTYDIVFEAPEFNGATLVKPAYLTVFWNGVLVQPRRQVMGPTSATATVHAYAPHAAELPLSLQDHSNPVRFRNVWIRRLSE
jgi:hypothetical protein